MPKPRVLFLCTGNACRSQMAEGWLRHLAGDRFDVISAGTKPAGFHPHAVSVMSEIGIDISRHRSKDAAEFLGQHIPCVVTVCDAAREACPVFRAAPIAWFTGSWKIPRQQPAVSKNGSPILGRVRDEIGERVRAFVVEQGESEQRVPALSCGGTSMIKASREPVQRISCADFNHPVTQGR